MGDFLRSAGRRWLEVVLPLYAFAVLLVYFRPQYLPAVFSQRMSESLWPWVAWGMVGTMTGILGLSALVLAGFLIYSPAYLVSKSLLLVGKAGWVDRRELSFYVSCFLLLCLLIFLLYFHPTVALSTFIMLAGFAPLIWRLLV